MTTSARASGSVENFAHVHLFFDIESKASAKLSPAELRKANDLCLDVERSESGFRDAALLRAGLATPGDDWMRQRLDRVLGNVFVAFEAFVGSVQLTRLIVACTRRLGSLGLPLAKSRREAPPHKPPPGSSAGPQACVVDFRLFDRLSQAYGGKFRGSVIANCVLALVASTALLFSLSPPFGAQALIDKIVDNFGNVPVATIIEFACIAAIWLIYTRGHTPDLDNDADEPRSAELGRRWGAQRWHQRWLEYRLLAERFRYVDLLLPLGTGAALDLSITPEGDAQRMWHQRYFAWRLEEVVAAQHHEATRAPFQTVRTYRDHALAVMAQQEAYHRDNHHRRGAIAHRLHAAAKLAFFATLAICVCEFARDLTAEDHSSALSCIAPDNVRMTLLFLAGVFPVFSAATYAVVTHAEYVKVADTSAQTEERVRGLFKRLAALPVSEDGASAVSLAPMRSVVLEFAGIAITEATGWRAMLRDKNVPLA